MDELIGGLRAMIEPEVSAPLTPELYPGELEQRWTLNKGCIDAAISIIRPHKHIIHRAMSTSTQYADLIAAVPIDVRPGLILLYAAAQCEHRIRLRNDQINYLPPPTEGM